MDRGEKLHWIERCVFKKDHFVNIFQPLLIVRISYYSAEKCRETRMNVLFNASGRQDSVVTVSLQ